MIKNTLIALIAVAGVAGITVPAFAAPVLPYDNSDLAGSDWPADSVLARLQAQGVAATGVEQWGGLVRAYVTLEDGSQVMQFFAPDSLNRVSL
ncbi:hypothetical protein VW29_20625 [Devosia limi DSM 17137]|uniref:Peptidase propeptide and YPEB domain-containing protein n=1 Tax=Devosia limi DSM 17137 TaxID=1121477 RepID=A0A0F5L3H2_9HYPH|nr:hypothetical protein [Devosia limi]KKB76157.1 hypothetical protein VW29_20625 [Devosia limi DSM 17137]SHF20952.1 hypothetical protein SAMN02745223_02063 [Devosia limi DSM 17137]